MVDESPFDGIDDDLDGVPDDIPDEVDTLDEFHFTVTGNPSFDPPPHDPQSDREAYRKLRCLTEDDCGERDHAADIRFMISCGPFDLPPGESQITGVAIVFANAVGDPDYLELHGDPPRPDPQDPVLSEFVATVLTTKTLYESGYEFEYDTFDILGTLAYENTNDPFGPYPIYTNIIDSVPLARNTIQYSVDGGPFEEVLMENQFMKLYMGEIPGQPFWSRISYYIQAVDSAYQVLRDPGNAPDSTFEFFVLDVTDFNRYDCGVCGNTPMIAPADFDRDGLIDLFFVTMGGAVLYRNLGDFSFDDVTSDAGIEIPTNARGASWGDYDNDSYPDLFVGAFSLDTPHLLFRNAGDGTFEEITSMAGVSDSIVTYTGIWGDVNSDGLLDLLTVQYGRNRLYLNNGDGTFTERAEEWGIGETGNDRAASFFDMEGDGDPDLLLTGGEECLVYENVGGAGFTDVTSTAGIENESWSSIASGDYDNDGDMDLLLSGGALTLYENTTGSGTFTDVTDDLGLAGGPTDASWSDLNADGYLDIVTAQPSVLIRKPSEGFVDLTGLSGISPEGGVGSFALPFDINNDGLIDVVSNDFWENSAYSGYFHRHWLSLSLQGTISNRSAYGARASLYSGGLHAARWISGGESISQDSPVLYFGLDTLSVVDSLVVDWPSGISQKLEGVGVDQFLLIEEDSTLGIGKVGDTAPGLPRTFSLMQNYPNPFNPATKISFEVPGTPGQKQHVRLVIYGMRGRLVKKLLDSSLEPGTHTVTWDGRNSNGVHVSSGAYLYMLKSGVGNFTRKMVVLK
jgi:hypothetical protein